MNITILSNGNLKMRVSDELERRAIQRMRNPHTFKTEARFIKRFLRSYGYKQIKPEDCGALTSATLITNATGEVWGDMQYQIESFIEKLASNQVTIWNKG